MPHVKPSPTFPQKGEKRSWKRLRRGFAILAATPPSKAEDQRPANPRETDSTQIAGGMRNDPGHASISPNLSLIFPHVVHFLYQAHAIIKKSKHKIVSKIPLLFDSAERNFTKPWAHNLVVLCPHWPSPCFQRLIRARCIPRRHINPRTLRAPKYSHSPRR